MYSTEAFKMVPLFQRMSLQREEALDNPYADPHLPDIGRMSSTIKKKKNPEKFEASPLLLSE